MSVLRSIHTWGTMIKFSHSIFALPFAVVAMMLAARELPRGMPAPGQVALIVLCMVAARCFAMTYNRIVDADLDARNPRTAGRPLAAGSLSRRGAWRFAFGAAALFVAGCGGFLAYGNRWPIVLALPVLAGLAFYSHTKRFTALAHFVLGGAIGSAPLAAWIAIHPPSLGWPAVVLAAAVALWIAGFDLIYACQDVAVDRRDGLFSVPARWGVPAALRLSRVAHGLTVALLLALGVLTGRGPVYAAGVVVVAALLVIEQSLVRPNDLSRVNLAFFTVNGVVSIAFATAAVVDVLV